MAKTEEIKKENAYKDYNLEAFLAELKKENPDLSVIKDGIEKYGTGKLSDSQKEKFLFEATLAEIGKDDPDMSVIRDGVEKYCTGKLSAKQNKQFLKTVFPEGNNYISLGFEKMTAIENTMAALVALSEDKKISQEQLKNMLLETNPHGGGKNIVTTIALNIRAGEFKLEKMDKDNKRVKGAMARLRQNLTHADAALAYLGKLDKDVLEEVLNTKDESVKGWNLPDLEKSGNSKILSKFMKNPSDYLENGYRSVLYPEEAEQITIDGENTTVVGGSNQTDVNTPQKQGLKVNAPNQENDDEGDEKVANMNPNIGEDGKKHKSFNIDKVKQQDIIDYMFENWLLEGITLALNAPFWVANKLLDAADSKFDTNVPKTPLKKGQKEKNTSAVKFLNNAGANTAHACVESINTQKEYYDKLWETISKNAGKDPKNWKSELLDGKPILDTENNLHLMKMEKFNEFASGNDFKNRLEELKNLSQEDYESVKNYIQIGARYAATLYIATHLKGPFDDSVQGDLNKMAMLTTKDLLNRINLIYERVEFNYKIEKGLNPDAELTPDQKEEIQKSANPILEKFTDELNKKGASLRSAIFDYHDRNTEEQKQTKEAAVLEKLSNFRGLWTAEYMDSICPSTLPQKQEYKELSIYELTEKEVSGENLQKMYEDMLNGKSKQLEDRMESSSRRKTAYKENPAFRRMMYNIESKKRTTSQKIEKAKDTGKQVAAVSKELGKAAVNKLIISPLEKAKNKLFGGRI